MPLHTPTLLVAFALVLVLASVASVSVGLKQQSRRGARWWVAANAFFAAALLLQATTDAAGIGAPIVAVLALQWPIVMLGGVRRFYSRGGTRISEWSDRIVLAVAALLTVGAWVEPNEFATYAQVHAMASLFLTPLRRRRGRPPRGLRDQLDPAHAAPGAWSPPRSSRSPGWRSSSPTSTRCIAVADAALGATAVDGGDRPADDRSSRWS